MTLPAANPDFQRVQPRGRRSGLGNLLRGEFSSWFGSRKWRIYTLVYIVAIDFILLMVALGGAPPEMILLYSIFGSVWVTFGVIITMQNAVIGEKKSGTAAWVLSKPVSRSAFILSKLVGNTTGLLVTAVLIPGVIAYLIYGTLTPIGWLPQFQFLGGMALQALQMLFWLTLTLMLGTLFSSAAAVIAIAIGFLFAQGFIIAIVPAMVHIFPSIISIPVERGDRVISSLVVSVIEGTPPFTLIPIISAAVLSSVFVAIAVWRFNRQEF